MASSFVTTVATPVKFGRSESVIVSVPSPAAIESPVSELHTGVKDKRLCLEGVQRRRSIDADETIVMGDDLPDLALLGACALFAAPRNAVAEVRARAGLVTRASGGAGAVRELVQAILVARGDWSALVARSVR